MDKITSDIIKTIIPIIIVAIILFCLIMITRCLFRFLIFILSVICTREKKTIEKTTPQSRICTNFCICKKEKDELLRDKKVENKKEKEILQNVKKINENFEKQMEVVEEEQDKIIGMIKPVGFWTSLLLGDQLSKMLGRAQALNNRSHKGFWVSMLAVQTKGLGKIQRRER